MKLLYRLLCLFGFHGKGKWTIQIVDVRYASHSIDYDQQYRCEHCSKIIPQPIDNE